MKQRDPAARRAHTRHLPPDATPAALTARSPQRDFARLPSPPPQNSPLAPRAKPAGPATAGSPSRRSQAGEQRQAGQGPRRRPSRLLKSTRQPPPQRSGGSSSPRVASSLGTCGGERGAPPTLPRPGGGPQDGVSGSPAQRSAGNSLAAGGHRSTGTRASIASHRTAPFPPVPLEPSFHSAYWRKVWAGLAHSPLSGWILSPSIKATATEGNLPFRLAVAREKVVQTAREK